MILNVWDIQSKWIHTTDGVSSTLYAGMCRWGGSELYVLITEESNATEGDMGSRIRNSIICKDAEHRILR